MKRNIAVIFGGVSCEHDISIITAQQVMSVISITDNVIPIYIDKNGKWKTSKKMLDIKNFPNKLGKTKEVALLASDDNLYVKKIKNYKKYKKIDVAVLALHGKNAEDGTIASILELNNIPYINSGVVGSAVGCDKIIFKTFIKGLKIPTVESISISVDDFYSKNFSEIENEIKESIGYPMIIKPANLGSSIGIKICKNNKELQTSLKEAFQFDERLLLEKFIKNCKEVNVAIYKHKNKLIISELEQPDSSDTIFSFNEKYLGKSLKSTEPLKRIMPPEIKQETYEKIIEYASYCYNELQLFGVVRFDFILDDKENIFINEVNTIPGSYAFYLFKKININLSQILDSLIDEAVVRVNKKLDLVNYFESSVLININDDDKQLKNKII